jgi:shikimate dehydrogenase
VIHSAGFAAAGLFDWSYEAIECAEDELAGLVAGLGPAWAGLSLTMPLKEAALSVAASVSATAEAAGAANTLVRRPDGTWHADNTDVPGMVRVLDDAGFQKITGPGDGRSPATPARRLAASAARTAPEEPVAHGAVPAVTILGAGGTARAALVAAAHLGACDVHLVARRPEAIEALTPLAKSFGLVLRQVAWADAATVFDADAVISTVPKGAADELAATVRWAAPTIFFDAVYDPWPTPLAASAMAAGNTVVSGLDLLLAQALSQFEQFTGVTPAPEAAMRAALLAAAAVR